MKLTIIGPLAVLVIALLTGCSSVKPVRVQASYKNVTVAMDLEIDRK